MKKDLPKRLQTRFYLDGGTGSVLLSMGLLPTHAELYNITHADKITALQRSYFQAGSDAVLTNTFGCNRLKADCSKYSLEEIITSACKLSRKVADECDGYVLYDCGPSGKLLYPNGDTTFEEAYDLFAEQAKIVSKCDVDGVIIETIGDLQEMRAAYLAFRENTTLPILCSMTFEKSGRTFTGTSVESFALTMQALGCDAIGMNCGTGPSDMLENIKRLVSCARKPVFAEPNAGLPRLLGGKTYYDTSATEFASVMREIAEAGVSVLGGCCGTTPDFIRETVLRTKNIPLLPLANETDGVCSFSKVSLFGKKSLVIGERLNPTGKPRLKQACLDRDYNYMLSGALAEMQEGADILDVNVGTAGCDESHVLPEAVAFLQGVADLPLCIDTSHAEALENAVRVTCGRCIVNSVNANPAVMEKVFPVVQKYGCYVVALCLDEKGIPSSVEGRIAVAEKILAEGKKYGIDKDRFLFDPLTMAVSVDKNNALITLQTLRALRKDLHVKTTLGLSNVSFGLPNRQILNGVFYSMTLKEDTTSAIVNPVLRPLQDETCALLLEGKDEGCKRYIEKFSVPVETERAQGNDLKTCILLGLADEAKKQAEKTATSDNYSMLIEKEIIGALNELGTRFSDGKVFLPQLIAGSEAAKSAIEYIRTTFIQGGEGAKATVLLATVHGDVHDIGKNIVKAVISNYGYRIVDLGKDVPEEEILQAVEREKPKAVGLSALMTTTLGSMERTAKLILERHPDVLVIVGGAVVNQEFADKIGALYAKDARMTADILEKNFNR